MTHISQEHHSLSAYLSVLAPVVENPVVIEQVSMNILNDEDGNEHIEEIEEDWTISDHEEKD